MLLLEHGQDHRPRSYYGTYLGALLYSDRGSLLFTEEGLNIIRPLMVGGATSMYCGCAAPPPTWFKAKYGVDIEYGSFRNDRRIRDRAAAGRAARENLHPHRASGSGAGISTGSRNSNS